MGVEYRGRIKAPSSSYRFCAVCKKKHGAVYPFPGTLNYHGIKGELATVVCIRLLAQKSVKEVRENVVKRTESSAKESEQRTDDGATGVYKQLAHNRRAFFRKPVVDSRDV